MDLPHFHDASRHSVCASIYITLIRSERFTVKDEHGTDLAPSQDFVKRKHMFQFITRFDTEDVTLETAKAMTNEEREEAMNPVHYIGDFDMALATHADYSINMKKVFPSSDQPIHRVWELCFL